MPDETNAPFRTVPSIRSPRGVALSCRSWAQEAALRMLMNTIEVGGLSHESVFGAFAPDHNGYEAIVRSLRALADDETLLIRAGKPVAIFQTSEQAPRVLMAGVRPDDRGPKPEECDESERAGLAMHGRFSAASWTDIGRQRIVQTTFEVFSAVADRHFGGKLARKLIVSGGMGEMGGAQSLAATMAGACFLGIEVDASRIKRQLRSGSLDFMVNSLDEALRILKNAIRKGENISVGLVGNCADVIPELAEHGVLPDILTDQTSADDPSPQQAGYRLAGSPDSIHGYVPNGLSLAEAVELRRRDPEAYRQRALAATVRHAEAIRRLRAMGAVAFDYGNHLWHIARRQGAQTAEILGFADYLRPLFRHGGPLCWVALSGEASDIAAIDNLVLKLFPQSRGLSRWVPAARRLRWDGLPARAAWLEHDGQSTFASAINELVSRGMLKAPVVIAHDHLDFSASLYAKAASGVEISSRGEVADLVEGPGDGGSWPLLSALLGTASGAVWVSMQSAGVPMATQIVIADGSDEMARRIARVLGNDSRLTTASFIDDASA